MYPCCTCSATERWAGGTPLGAGDGNTPCCGCADDAAAGARGAAASLDASEPPRPFCAGGAPPLAAACAARFCTRQRYFWRCDLMFAFVRPSTFISRRIDFGFALSRPSAFTAASKRECRSGVHTNRRLRARASTGRGR